MPIDDEVTLATESDVEQKVLMPLLTDGPLLAISKTSVHTKQYLAAAALDKAGW